MGNSVVKLYVLWFAPEEGNWKHGWKEYYFHTPREAWEFCRKYTDGNKHPEERACIELAELSVDRAEVVRDGRMVCESRDI